MAQRHVLVCEGTNGVKSDGFPADWRQLFQTSESGLIDATGHFH
jgi:hypothetical protein